MVQNDLFNSSRINTVVVCMVTSNLSRAKAPGNVLLRKGEANLPKRSVVNISQVSTVDRADLLEKIGTLSDRRLGEILEGLSSLLKRVKIEERN